MQWLMLQQEQPDDYVIASGQQYSVKDFITQCGACIGIEIEFKGDNLEEVGIIRSFDNKRHLNLKNGQKIIEVAQKYFRPSEVHSLLGDFKKARDELGWSPTITFEKLCKEMIESDLNQVDVMYSPEKMK